MNIFKRVYIKEYNHWKKILRIKKFNKEFVRKSLILMIRKYYYIQLVKFNPIIHEFFYPLIRFTSQILLFISLLLYIYEHLSNRKCYFTLKDWTFNNKKLFYICIDVNVVLRYSKYSLLPPYQRGTDFMLESGSLN